MVISIYLAVAIVCAILLAISAMFSDFGGDMDADADIDGVDADFDGDVGHGDFSGAGITPLSVPVLLVFGTLFGAFGTIFEGMEFDVYMVPLFSLGIATVITIGVFLTLVRVFIKTQATTQVDLKELIGKEGETTMPIKEGAPGQIVIVTEQRGRTLLHAISDSDISTNSVVKITEVVGNGVKVVRTKGGK